MSTTHIDHHSFVNQKLSCALCHYNLYLQHVDNDCPECGLEIQRSFESLSKPLIIPKFSKRVTIGLCLEIVIVLSCILILLPRFALAILNWWSYITTRTPYQSALDAFPIIGNISWWNSIACYILVPIVFFLCTPKIHTAPSYYTIRTIYFFVVLIATIGFYASNGLDKLRPILESNFTSVLSKSTFDTIFQIVSMLLTAPGLFLVPISAWWLKRISIVIQKNNYIPLANTTIFIGYLYAFTILTQNIYSLTSGADAYTKWFTANTLSLLISLLYLSVGSLKILLSYKLIKNIRRDTIKQPDTSLIID
ncbi:hypothetical protein [Poriferisphaera sp. WC338]|uniref:hypothetical protein n=1 Tax=Poriferisphaera sp. WC338 TaxID=3425129 RepID=UPI003D815E8B